MNNDEIVFASDLEEIIRQNPDGDVSILWIIERNTPAMRSTDFFIVQFTFEYEIHQILINEELLDELIEANCLQLTYTEGNTWEYALDKEKFLASVNSMEKPS